MFKSRLCLKLSTQTTHIVILSWKTLSEKAEDLSAIKYFSTFLIFIASLQISAFLKMNTCLQHLSSLPSTSTNAYAAIFTVMESWRHMQNELHQRGLAFIQFQFSALRRGTATLVLGKRDHCRRWEVLLIVKQAIPNTYDSHVFMYCLKRRSRQIHSAGFTNLYLGVSKSPLIHTSLTEPVKTWESSKNIWI